MIDYTRPITATFELQRQAIEQHRRALEQGVELQQRWNQAVLDSLESTEAAQRRTAELQQQAFHDALDAVEVNVPGVGSTVEDMREAGDEGFEVLLDNHAEAFDTFAAEFDESVDAYDGFSADYLAALDEQVDLLLEAHEEWETQSVEAVEQLATGVEELQAQVEDVSTQVREMQSQATAVVEA